MTQSLLEQLNTMTVTVADTGEGISAEDLPSVFNRFFRGDRSRLRDGQGTGLGLAIVRAVVQAHGGEIFAESARGEGTTFTVALPTIQTSPTARSDDGRVALIAR